MTAAPPHPASPRCARACPTALPSTRHRWTSRPSTLRVLADAAALDDVACRFLTTTDERAAVTELIAAANLAQLADRAFMSELRDWIRFSEGSALATRDGLFAGCTGNPTIPDWLGR